MTSLTQVLTSPAVLTGAAVVAMVGPAAVVVAVRDRVRFRRQYTRRVLSRR